MKLKFEFLLSFYFIFNFIMMFLLNKMFHIPKFSFYFIFFLFYYDISITYNIMSKPVNSCICIMFVFFCHVIFKVWYRFWHVCVFIHTILTYSCIDVVFILFFVSYIIFLNLITSYFFSWSWYFFVTFFFFNSFNYKTVSSKKFY